MTTRCRCGCQWANLNQPETDLALAKQHVDEAILIVPHWHYARSILRPQIEAAGRKAPGR